MILSIKKRRRVNMILNFCKKVKGKFLHRQIEFRNGLMFMRCKSRGVCNERSY